LFETSAENISLVTFDDSYLFVGRNDDDPLRINEDLKNKREIYSFTLPKTQNKMFNMIFKNQDVEFLIDEFTSRELSQGQRRVVFINRGLNETSGKKIIQIKILY
jgi:hypothetical protein